MKHTLSFMWNELDDQSRVSRWLLRFRDVAAMDEFKQGLLRAMWERFNQTRWPKMTLGIEDSYRSKELTAETLPISRTTELIRTTPRSAIHQPPRKMELTIANECKVCFGQLCDSVLLPCAHLALCEVCFSSSVSSLILGVCKDCLS